jgi:hypothetical protein
VEESKASALLPRWLLDVNAIASSNPEPRTARSKIRISKPGYKAQEIAGFKFRLHRPEPRAAFFCVWPPNDFFFEENGERVIGAGTEYLTGIHGSREFRRPYSSGRAPCAGVASQWLEGGRRSAGKNRLRRRK